MKQFLWLVASVTLIAVGILLPLPYVRSEALGVIWPSEGKVLVSAAFVLAGLCLAPKAGRLQYVAYVALAVWFAIFVLAQRMVLDVAGVQGIG